MGVHQKMKRHCKAPQTTKLGGREPAGDARCIATLPGAAARAPNKQDSDVRPRGAAAKVRTPFRQSSNATLEAAFAFGEQPVTVARGNEPTNHRHTTGAISFPVRLVTTTGTTFGADTQ
jgi:hypothetical protein